MNKKVYFYTADIFNNENENENHSYGEIKEFIVNIINEKAEKTEGFKVLDLSEKNQLHQSADIFEYENDYLFMRASNQKPSGAYLQRNYATNLPGAVLEGSSEKAKGIEQYTYLYLNYVTGILGVIKQQGAPTSKILNTMFSKYNPKYDLKFTAIPNPYGIERIYMGKEPTISKVEIEVPVPNAEVLESWFGWNTKDILSIQSGTLKATLKLSGVERKLITNDVNETKGLLDCIKSKLSNYKKAKVRGKIKGEKTQDYSFFDENFSYPIDIVPYIIEDSEKIYLSAEKLISIYRDNLLMAYNENRNMLIEITNR